MSVSGIRVAIVGDYDAAKETHQATNDELEAAGAAYEWVPTATVTDAAVALGGFTAVMIAPGGPYVDVDGALRAIEYARLRQIPFVAMCNGFQHVVLEFARNASGLSDAAHAEADPGAELLAVTPLACSLVGQRQRIQLEPQSRVATIYGADEVVEPFYCSYGLNPELEPDLQAAGFHISGRDEAGSARVIDLDDHPFFVATLFVFQARDTHTPPHPLTAAFLNMAAGRTPPAAVRMSPPSGGSRGDGDARPQAEVG